MTKIWQYSDCEEFKPSLNKKGQDKYNRKMLAVLISYMMRLTEGESPYFQKEKEEILKICFPLIEMFYDVAREVHQGITMGQIPQTKFNSQGLLLMAELSQNLA